MAKVEDTLRELREAISRAQGKKAHAAVQVEDARAKLATARATLKEEFGVVTTPEARAKLLELQEDLDREVAEISRLLDEAGA